MEQGGVANMTPLRPLGYSMSHISSLHQSISTRFLVHPQIAPPNEYAHIAWWTSAGTARERLQRLAGAGAPTGGRSGAELQGQLEAACSFNFCQFVCFYN